MVTQIFVQSYPGWVSLPMGISELFHITNNCRVLFLLELKTEDRDWI